MRIILGAVISLPPFAPGIAWDWIQIAVGLRRLGHDVYYVEEVEPSWCVDAHGARCDLAHSQNRRRFARLMRQFDLDDKSFQLMRGDESTVSAQLRALLAERPDLLINIAGHVTSPLVLEGVRVRAYYDQDPVYTQLWRAEYGKELNFAMHDVFLTVGLNIGTDITHIPDCGVPWHRVPPPVVMDFWPRARSRPRGRLTTIASWSGFSELCYRGEWYRGKYEEFRRFAELPRHVTRELEVALRWYPNEEAAPAMLRDHGWVVSRTEDIATLSGYRDFIARSWGEIGIAKHAYVKGRSGWFSDRSTHYLASGRPVLAQSTGFEHTLPAGRGLLSFSTIDEAIAGVEELERDYTAHTRAARELAAEYLDYRKVLPPLLEACAT
jgi:hypothetical protein